MVTLSDSQIADHQTNRLMTTDARRPGTAQGIVLMLMATLSVMGILLIAPILPSLQAHYESVPGIAFLAPIIMTVPALCVALFSPLAGYMADRLGRRALLFTAIALYAPLGVAPLFVENIWVILSTRVGVGIMEAVIMTVSTAMIGDYFEGREREKWLAAQVACSSIAAVVLLLGAGLLGSLHWRAPFAAYALALILLFAAVNLIWEPNRRVPLIAMGASATFPWPIVLGICGVTVVASLIFYIVPIQMGFILGEQGIKEPATVGTIAAIGAITVPIGSVAYHNMPGMRVGVILAIGFGLSGLGLLGIASTHSLPTTIPGVLVNQLGCGMLLPALVAWMMSKLPVEHRGRGVGLWMGSMFVGQFVSPIVIGVLGMAIGGLLPALAVFGIVGIVSAVAAIALTRSAPVVTRDAGV